MGGSRESGVGKAAHRVEDAIGGIIGKARAEMAGSSTTEFARTAHIADHYEIEAARIALQRSDRPRVREIAETMIADHEDSIVRRAHAIAAMAEAIPLRDALDARHQGLIDHLCDARDRDFETVYLNQQKAAHDEAITLFDRFQARASGPLADYAREMLPHLRRHARMVDDLLLHMPTMV